MFTFVTFHYLGIDTAVFSSFGGEERGYIGTGPQFVVIHWSAVNESPRLKHNDRAASISA
jgi:hypothetical protein